MLKTVLLLSLSLCTSGFASELPPDEKQLIANVEKHYEESALNFLKKTVDINSDTQNPKGVLAVSDIYEARLKELGFSTTKTDLQKVARGVHLFAERRTYSAAPKFFLIGHLDTVFKSNSSFQLLTIHKDGKITGPGVSDMKGGNLVILEVLEALKSTGELEKMNIKVAFTGDEESIGRDADRSFTTSRQLFKDFAKGRTIF